MNYQITGFLAYTVGFILMLTFCEFLNRKMNIPSEYTRKIAHVLSALATLLFPYVFKDVGYALVLSALFFLILFIARRKRTLPSIDIVGRKTGGSYFLALGIGATYYVSVVFDNNMLFTLPILIFAICDPLACIAGKKIKSKRIHNGKTTIGSFFFFLSSLLICLCYLMAVRYESVVLLSLLIALTTTIAEMLSTRGTDNLTIPLSAAGVMILHNFLFI